LLSNRISFPRKGAEIAETDSSQKLGGLCEGSLPLFSNGFDRLTTGVWNFLSADGRRQPQIPNVWKIPNGDLAAKPLIAVCEDYSHICRTTAIDPKEMFK